jgi:hypothetical protein
MPYAYCQHGQRFDGDALAFTFAHPVVPAQVPRKAQPPRRPQTYAPFAWDLPTVRKKRGDIEHYREGNLASNNTPAGARE